MSTKLQQARSAMLAAAPVGAGDLLLEELDAALHGMEPRASFSVAGVSLNDDGAVETHLTMVVTDRGLLIVSGREVTDSESVGIEQVRPGEAVFGISSHAIPRSSIADVVYSPVHVKAEDGAYQLNEASLTLQLPLVTTSYSLAPCVDEDCDCGRSEDAETRHVSAGPYFNYRRAVIGDKLDEFAVFAREAVALLLG